MHTVLARFLNDCDADPLVRKVSLSLIYTAGDLSSRRSSDSNWLGRLCRWGRRGYKPGEFYLQGPVGGGGGGGEEVDTNREQLFQKTHLLIIILIEVCFYLNFLLFLLCCSDAVS